MSVLISSPWEFANEFHGDSPFRTCRPVLLGGVHTHLPWLAHHGSWPVGEEWLYQAWSTSYLPLVDLLHELAAEGRRDVLTLGLTPVLAAQLDDPYCLSEEQTWLGFWDARALALASDRDPVVREAGAREHRASRRALDSFDRHWRAGGSGALRPLIDAGVIELLGGPATHPFQPGHPNADTDLALNSSTPKRELRTS